MKKFQTSFVAAVLIIFGLNGWALLQHLGMVPRHDGFTAAVFVVNMLCVPVALWAAFVFGEVEMRSNDTPTRRRA